MNAGLFEAVLTYVNQHKDPAAHEQNVVMGLSMGGNIARYKLAEMTRAGRPTDVRLLILHDSPQRGANIPLGLSALVRQLQFDVGPFNIADIVGAIKQANDLLDSPAARQLLLYQTYLRNTTQPGGGSVLSTTVEYTANSFIEGPYRQMINYAAPYRIIAVSQGSQCGQGLFEPYTELIRAGGRLNLYNMPYFFLGGSEGINGEVIVNAIPAGGQAQRVAGLHVFEEAQIFFGLIRKRSDLTRQNFTCPTGLLPLDGAAGGTEGIGSTIGSTNGILIGTATIVPYLFRRPYAAVFSLVNDFGFVPTPSALDIQDFTLPSLSASYSNGIPSVSSARVNAFLAQERFTPTNSGRTPFNQAHVSFTPRNTEWVFDQMENRLTDAAAVSCSAECDPLAGRTFSGPANLCGTATYSAPITNPSFTYSWQASPANLFSSASGTGPTFQTSSQNMAGYTASITLTIRGGCSPIVLTRYVTSGSPASPASRGPNWGNDCGSVPVRCTIDNYDPSLAYTVTVSGDLRLIGGGVQEDGTYTVRSSRAGGTGTITLTARNSCGTSTSTMNATSPTCNGQRFTMSPNPAADELVVQETNGDSTASAAARSTNDGIESLRLYDSYGQLRLEQAGHQAQAVRLAVGQLPAGIYVLHIVQAGAIVSQQRVEIAH